MDGSTVYHRRQASVPPPRCAPPQSPARAGPPPPATFWTRHPVVSALLHDILLWVRPAATALVYGGLVWLFFILRALVPHGSSSDSSSSSTSAALFVLGAGAVLGTLALRWAADALGQSPVLACLARAPVLLCAAPRDDAALAARAARVEHTVAAARTRVVAVLTELHLAAGGAAGTPEAAAAATTAGAVRLTVLGKTVLGVACLAMALVTSLASTGAVVAVAALVAAVVPPVVHYELVRRFFEALSNASQAAQKQDQQQSKAADK